MCLCLCCGNAILKNLLWILEGLTNRTIIILLISLEISLPNWPVGGLPQYGALGILWEAEAPGQGLVHVFWTVGENQSTLRKFTHPLGERPRPVLLPGPSHCETRARNTPPLCVFGCNTFKKVIQHYSMQWLQLWLPLPQLDFTTWSWFPLSALQISFKIICSDKGSCNEVNICYISQMLHLIKI